MSQIKEQSIQELLNGKKENVSPLLNLIEKVSELESLTSELYSSLPSELAHGKVASFDKGILTIVYDSAHAATKARFFVPQMLTLLRNNTKWCHLRSIQVKVGIFEQKYCYTAPEPTAHSAQKITISEDTSALLQNCAQGIEDTDLREVLERMSKLSST